MNEKALQALERMSSDNGYDYTKEDFESDYNLVETTLKASEIIKEKRVDVGLLLDSEDVSHYNYRIEEKWKQSPRRITQEEYNLLKEVLL